nr:LysE family translocator [Pseudarthrobacter albicanus]
MHGTLGAVRIGSAGCLSFEYDHHRCPPAVRPGRRLAIRTNWLSGVTTSLLNPKVGVFYMAMIPQFLPADAPPLLMGALLPLVHNAEAMPWFAAIIVATHRARRWFQSAAVGKATDRVAGVFLLAFAAKIAATRA